MSAVRRRRAAAVWLLTLAVTMIAASTGCGRFLDGDPPTTMAGGTPAAAGAVATPSSGPDAYERSGRTGDLRLVLPGPDTAGPYPLIVALHSLYHDGTETRAWGFDQLATTAGFAVVHPDGIGDAWNAGSCCGSAANKNTDDVDWLRSMIAHLESNYPIDPQRVILVGLSNGGMLAYRYACEYPAEIAGIAVIAGSLQVLGCRPPAPVTVVSVHGGLDGHVPGAGTPWSTALNTAIRSTTESLAPFRAADHCPLPAGPGDVTLTGSEGAPRLSGTTSTGSAAVTPAEVRGALDDLAPTVLVPPAAGSPADAVPANGSPAEPAPADGAPAKTPVGGAAPGPGGDAPVAGGVPTPSPGGTSTPAPPAANDADGSAHDTLGLVQIDPAASPAVAVRGEATCDSAARVVEYSIPNLDHGWPALSGPTAFDTAGVIWQLLGAARATIGTPRS